jgi:prepilin-type N-terminal cleavage/methylation domain-containing protein
MFRLPSTNSLPNALTPGPSPRGKGGKQAFTLIELLVVIAIIAILSAILFPVFAQAKLAGKKTVNVSNLRQIGIAVTLYVTDNDGYPMMSSPSGTVPRTRWPDYIYPYVKNEPIFNSPLAPKEMFQKAWAHNPTVKYGGYGYNYQYFGNTRLAFAATESAISHPAETVIIADTNGVRRDNGSLSGGEYTIDPPLTSARGSGKPSGYYGDGAECGSGAPGPGVWGCRSTPAERYAKKVCLTYADGHAGVIALNRLDDYNGDGAKDNGFWNGLADALMR